MTPKRRLSQPEFVGLMAMHFAMVAFSIDTMLPALTDIGRALSPDDINRAQFIITAFVLGMGLGTLFAGPISDRYGRKRVILASSVIYIGASILAWRAASLEMMVLARVAQGLGASGPRTVGLAIVRDLYSGREMARITSFMMLVFSIAPAIGPLLGAVLIDIWHWRAIFLAFVVFSIVQSLWLAIRQAETLPPEARRPLEMRRIIAGIREVLSNRMVTTTIAVQALCMGMLFSVLVSTQPVFERTFDRAESFPYWFAVIAVLSASANFLNARLVIRLGMRRLIIAVISAQVALSGAMAVTTWAGIWPEAAEFGVYVAWITSVFFMVGMTLGNLNALALEPMGHIAGLAASVVSSLATITALIIAVPIGLAFDGTPLPLAVGVFCCAVIAVFLMRFTRGEKPGVAAG